MRALIALLFAVLPALSQNQASWVEPTRAEPAGTRYRTFHSNVIQSEVSYLVYLPPGYETDSEKRYPVVYWLHGLGGNQRTGSHFVERFDKAVRSGASPPMIVVLVNGMRASMYCDSADGKTPVESVIVKDLIPHVDAAYRTIPSRESRVIDGFSMGGFGAARLGFKYPETFGVVSILAGALHTADTLAERRTAIFQATFSSNKDYFQAESPWTLVEKNAERIRGRTHVRVWVGEKDQLLEWNTQYHELLEKLGIIHDFQVFPGVAHNARQMYAAAGDKTFAFYRQAGLRPVRDLQYCTGGGRPLRMYVAEPGERQAKPAPAVVWIHGGGWQRGSRNSGLPLLGRMAQQGYVAASIEYRLSGEAIFPAQIEDSKCAIRYLRANAKNLGIDPDRIGAWGSSAGGHLAALLGTAGGAKNLEGKGGWPSYSSRVQAAADWFGPTDFLQMDRAGSTIRHDAPDSPESKLIGGPIQQNKAKAEWANPIKYVSGDDPPFLIMHGDQDRLVPLDQSRLLYEALKKAGVDATFHVMKGQGHGFRGPEARQMVEEFFDRHLKRR